VTFAPAVTGFGDTLRPITSSADCPQLSAGNAASASSDNSKIGASLGLTNERARESTKEHRPVPRARVAI